VKDYVSYPHKTTGTIIVLCSLIFNRLDDNSLGSE